MGYTAGIMDTRIEVLSTTLQDTDYGRVASTWTSAGSLWANVTWSKGAKALREGVLDAYDVIMVRTRYKTILTRDCRIKWRGRVYAIESYHSDWRANTIQLTAREIEE